MAERTSRFSVHCLAGLLLAAAPLLAAPPLTLQTAVQQALQNNLASQLARERTVESRAQRGIGLSSLLPNVSGAAYQTNLTYNLAAQGFTSDLIPGIPAFVGPYNRFDARLQLVQSVFNMGYLRRYQATRHGVLLAERQRRLAEQQVTTATALEYMAVLEAEQSVAAASANVQLAERLRRLATNQRQAGVATGVDVARAETRLANQQVVLAQARTNLDTARLNLLRLTGGALAGQVTLAESLQFAPEKVPEAAGAIEQALAERIELRVAEEQVRMAVAERKAALGGYLPSVAVFGDYGSSGLKPNDVNLPTRSVGVRVDVPVFNGGRTRSEVQAAASRQRQAEMQLADLRAAVEKDVRQALDNLATREEQMRAAQKTLDLALKELSLAEDRFQNGVADNVEVTNAQTVVENARQVVVASLAQFNMARLNLAAARGRVEDFRL